MNELFLHERHRARGAHFGFVNGMEVVEDYGDVPAEYSALSQAAGVLDLSFRGRLCLTGPDRKRFLHGQVTNQVHELEVGQGCYAALTTAKGKMESDLYIYCLPEELLLDFEPGLTARVAQRLERYVIADDVQITDVGPHYGLLGVQGPEAGKVLAAAGLGVALPEQFTHFTSGTSSEFGEIYCVCQRLGTASGWELFVPLPALQRVHEKLVAHGARPCGWRSLEMVRIEAGRPRFGMDMDATNLPPETGIDQRAVSYTKGCYIGQEVIARIRTYGQVAKSLRRLRLSSQLTELPKRGDKLYHGEKEAGYITSALASPALKANIALGYVRREHNQPGIELTLRSASGESAVRLAE